VKVSYHIFKDFKVDAPVGATDEEIMRATTGNAAKIKQLRYSFVCMRYHPYLKKFFVGATNGARDLLLEFDPRTRKFESCGYDSSDVGNEHDVKIHQGLWLNEKDNSIYFGTATLSRLPLMIESTGGSLVRYDISERKFTCLGNPTPGDFYQGSCFDYERGKAYMVTIHGCFVVYDYKNKKLIRYQPVESTPHNACIDDDGCVWSSYGHHMQAFFRYLPDEDRFEFPTGCAYPNALEASGLMYRGAGPVDSIINGGDGYLYTGSALGELYRLDPREGKLEFLGKPFPDKRLPGLTLGSDGYLYVCGGVTKASMLARYDREAGRFERFGPVVAPDGTECHYCHEVAVLDGVVYIGETDNPKRSGYMWVCEL